ncbi:hypothetical protein SD81_016230 [Tolypothrix campylonemoides VB511288]|nr:hypothetical protein SD81_016230 [Tolypothrix campylonemoides VB511288]
MAGDVVSRRIDRWSGIACAFVAGGVVLVAQAAHAAGRVWTTGALGSAALLLIVIAVVGPRALRRGLAYFIGW